MKYQINNGDSWSTISKEQDDKCCEIFDCRIVNDYDVPESPTTTVAPPVSEQEGGIEERANLAGIKYALKGVYPSRYCKELEGQSESCRDRYTPFVDGFIAGANSVRQQGDVGYLVDALRDIDLEADFVDPPSTVKRCGEITRKALTKYYETQKQQS